MRSYVVATLALTFLYQAAADLDVDPQDVPVACQAICRPTLELSRTCDVDDDLVGGDAVEVQGEQACYCQNQSFDVGRMTALCQSCVQQNAFEFNDAREVNDIMALCAFQTAQFTAADANAANGVVVQAAPPRGQDTDLPGQGPPPGKGKNRTPRPPRPVIGRDATPPPAAGQPGRGDGGRPGQGGGGRPGQGGGGRPGQGDGGRGDGGRGDGGRPGQGDRGRPGRGKDRTAAPPVSGGAPPPPPAGGQAPPPPPAGGQAPPPPPSGGQAPPPPPAGGQAPPPPPPDGGQAPPPPRPTGQPGQAPPPPPVGQPGQAPPTPPQERPGKGNGRKFRPRGSCWD